MPAILQQLQARVPGFPTALTDFTKKNWTFNEQIKKKENDFFSTLILKNPLLFTQYQIHCSHIVHLLNKADSHNTTNDADSPLQYIETALVIAELLEQIYNRLDEKSNLEQLRYEQSVFRELLAGRYSQFKSTNSPTLSPQNSFNQKIRLATKNSNLPRQTVNRLRYLIRYAILLDELVMLREWIEPFERMISPVLLHLNWIFFIPRLTVNIILLNKHVILNPWMSKQERVLPWQTRLHVHLMINRRWIELINDFIWCVGNLLCTFLCTGAWEFIENYFAIGLQLFDLVFTCVYVVIEINRLNTLEKEYQKGCANTVGSIDNDYLHALRKRIIHEKNIGYLALLNHGILLFAIMTILPVISTLSPLAPLFGAAFSILTTISISIIEAYLKKQYSHDGVSSLTQHRFFKPCSTSKNQLNVVNDRSILLDGLNPS